MKTHAIPEFPLSANVWHFGTLTTGPPDLVTLAQLHVGVAHRQLFGLATQCEQSITRFIYVPARTDIRPFWTNSPDAVEIPAGSGRFYTVMDVEDVARGFSNEFRIGALFVSQTVGPAPWPLPIP